MPNSPTVRPKAATPGPGGVGVSGGSMSEGSRQLEHAMLQMLLQRRFDGYNSELLSENAVKGVRWQLSAFMKGRTYVAGKITFLATP
jgi:hypothetical protein